MRTGISITLMPGDRRRLEALVRDRNAPHKHGLAGRDRAVDTDGIGTNEIMRQTGKSKTCVWRWQERFMQEGYDGLLHDRRNLAHQAACWSDIAARVVVLTQTDPPADAQHTTGLPP